MPALRFICASAPCVALIDEQFESGQLSGYCSGAATKRPVRCSVCGPELPPTWLTSGTNHGACSLSHAAEAIVSPVCVSVSSWIWTAANCSATERRVSSAVMYSSSGTVCPLERATCPVQCVPPGALAVMLLKPSMTPPVALP